MPKISITFLVQPERAEHLSGNEDNDAAHCAVMHPSHVTAQPLTLSRCCTLHYFLLSKADLLLIMLR